MSDYQDKNILAVKQASILSVLQIISTLLGLFTFLLLDLIVEDMEINFHTIDEYIAKMDFIVNYWWIIPLWILITCYTAYIAIIRWDKRGVKKVMYDEAVYWLNFTTILFILIDIGWLLMWYLSELEGLSFLVKIESLLATVVLAALFLYTLSAVKR